MDIFPPGSKIGILGGGQNARMTAMAAARLGYKCHIYCESDDEPALHVADAHTIASYTDENALEKFAPAVDLVTLEWENVPLQSSTIIGKIKPVLPGPHALCVAQDRGMEKIFARQHDIPTTAFAMVNSEKQLDDLMKTFSLPAILKPTRMSYEDVEKIVITRDFNVSEAWRAMGSESGILEAFVDFACEVSIIVVRRADGEMVFYPAVETFHRDHILTKSRAPADIDPAIANEALSLARSVAEKLEITGLLAVGMFVLKEPDAKGKRVLLNKIAPRTHSSGHWTIDACACSQFEQLIRAICGLPLGSTEPHSRADMIKLFDKDIDEWAELLKDSSACLHIYGKADKLKGVKTGHVTFLKGLWNK